MQIIHKLDDFFYSLFPSLKKGDGEGLIEYFTEYYTYQVFKPRVTLRDGLVIVDIDTSAIISQEGDYRRAVALCQKGNYDEAKPVLNKLIEVNPTNSEYHRILGQAYSDQGDQDAAIDSLIDALRWDPKNKWALVMMGNIFARFKDNLDVAMKYYDQALKIDPEDFLTLNNIAANLTQQKKYPEAKRYFQESIRAKGDYPNAYYGMATVSIQENELHAAFESGLNAIKFCKSQDAVFTNARSLVFDVSRMIVKLNQEEKILNEYYRKLEFKGNVGIELVQDSGIPTAAKFEFAENYKREKHVLRYNPSYPAVLHLVFHELIHLDLALQARESGTNQIFYSTGEHRSRFLGSIEPTIRKYRKLGMTEKHIEDACDSLFNGLNTQAYNTPIDLFIEDFIYREHPLLRPYQFLSLHNMIQLGVKATTDKKIVDMFPAETVSKSKIFNLVSALHFQDLYHLDLVRDFKALPLELKKARTMFDEFQEYRDDRKPGEEYELVTHWAEDLGLDRNFDLREEGEYRNSVTDVDRMIESLEKDPLGLDSDNLYKERQTQKFLKSEKAKGLNMAVVMFMVGALKHFRGMAQEEIKKTAFEIAWLGTQGINPSNTNYTLNSIPDKEFSGYQMLAYYYISWKLAVPEMLSQLNLPYDKEYEAAMSLYKLEKNE